MEVNLSKKCEIEFHDLATLFQKLPADLGFDALLVADAPIDIPDSDHRWGLTLLSDPGWLRDQGTLLPAWIWRCWVRPMSCLGSVVGVS